MKSSVVQIIVLGGCILIGLVAVIVFSKFNKDGGAAGTENVVVWGTLPRTAFNIVSAKLNLEKPGSLSINYVEKNTDTFEDELTEALLSGEGPDVVILPHEILHKHERRLTLIGFDSLPERNFKDTFAEAGEVFLTKDGSYALPFLIDPLVMYWNRDTLNSKAISLPPSKWEDITTLSERLTEKTEGRLIRKSAIAFGEFVNVTHAKEVLAALALQAGTRFTERDNTGKLHNVSAKNTLPTATADTYNEKSPLALALSFYTSFADTSKPQYSWNRSFADSVTVFSRGDIALLPGFASDLKLIRDKNPNLNFDLTTLPQAKSLGDNKVTFGRVYGLAILGSSKYKLAAWNTIQKLTSPEVEKLLAEEFSLAPSRRDLLASAPSKSEQGAVWQSAIFSRAWVDPDPSKTTGLFKDMIESVTTGRLSPENAAEVFANELDEILGK